MCLRRLLLLLLSLGAGLSLAACRSGPAAPPTELIVFDVSAWHLDHFALCGGPCDRSTPPPDGKTHADLLADYDRLIFLSTLQGLLNQDRPQLYLIHHPSDRFWLQTYQTPDEPYGWLTDTTLREIDTFESLLDYFAPQITGLVVWDADVPATLNVATTVAGAEGWPVVRAGSALAASLSRRWPVQLSLAGRFADDLAAYEWAVEEYLWQGKSNATFTAYVLDGMPAQHYLAGRLTRGGVYALERDAIVQQRGFAFDLSPWRDENPDEAAAFAGILQAHRQEAGLRLIKVWGFVPWYEKYAAPPGDGGTRHPVEAEWESTWNFSYYAGYLQGGGGDAWGVAMANVSVHRFGPPPDAIAPAEPPTAADLMAQGYLLPDGRVDPERTFLLFYAGDYDLVHPTQVAWANWWRSTWHNSGRGNIPLAWGINPGMEEDIPAIMSYMLATRSPNDYLVAANSGAGYVNPQAISRRYRGQWLNRSGHYYQRYGLTVQGFVLNGRGYDLPPEWAARFTRLAPDGIIAPDFEIQNDAWPQLIGRTPYTGMIKETLGDSVPGSAANLHQAYLRTLAEDRPPFLAVRSAFQKPDFLAQVYAQAQADDEAGQVQAADGTVFHPNYTLVDPDTFFALLKIHLQTPSPVEVAP